MDISSNSSEAGRLALSRRQRCATGNAREPACEARPLRLGYGPPIVKEISARRRPIGSRRRNVYRDAMIGVLAPVAGLALLGSGDASREARAPRALAAPPSDDGSDQEPGWTEAQIAELMTSEHNRARARVRTGEPLPGLAWSTPLANLAREWANQLAQRCQKPRHSAPAKHGQNLASRASMGSGSRFSPAEVVAGWMAEAPCWTPGKFGTTDRCDKACVGKLESTGCGHYTQVVWRNTRQLGCGYATCKRDGFLVELWACNYSLPGNIRGQEPY